ncbi:zinc-binding dehydrogenase [Phytohabitans flavus]|uniref:Enoyl reductase (ER) domain-containing protein n=1 Tax=Phytohabitans flavus TaxID=1076124 RepID=A0A6F8XVJ7_9ACTN|nr:zinc-binding dehydrogenase [Phytohabitans flavus]BCB77864.1 hypothetical protein Pflav_042740 [Phytohabitans flavus]
MVAKANPTDGGGFGEYLTTAAGSGIALVPPGLDEPAAAALGLAGAAALAVVDSLAAKPGETVLVSGATGGVGAFAVQLLADRGVTVIATAPPASAGHVRGLGAAHDIDHGADLAAQLRDLAPGGVDAVAHLAGDGVALAELLRPGGRIVSALHLDPAGLPRRDITGTSVMADPSRDVLDRLAREVAAGRLRVPVGRTLPLAELPPALAGFSNGTLGKLGVQVASLG